MPSGLNKCVMLFIYCSMRETKKKGGGVQVHMEHTFQHCHGHHDKECNCRHGYGTLFLNILFLIEPLADNNVNSFFFFF